MSHCQMEGGIIVQGPLAQMGATSGLGKPIGVAEWQTKLVKSLPKELKGSLPTVEEIEKELDDGR